MNLLHFARAAPLGDHVHRHPILGAIEITLLWHAVLIGVAKGLPPLAPDWFPGLGASIVNLAGALVILALLHAWGLLRPAGVTTLGRNWWLVLPLLVVALSYSLAGIAGAPEVLIGGAVALALVGVNEEIYSRGLSLQVALPLGPRRAAILIAVLFGVGHIQNYLLFGKPLDDTLVQIVSAGLYGFCLAGVRLRIGTIWPLAFVHGLDDWMQIYSPGKAPDWWQYTVLLFLLCYGFALTRKPAPRRLRAAAVFADSLRKLRSCA